MSGLAVAEKSDRNEQGNLTPEAVEQQRQLIESMTTNGHEKHDTNHETAEAEPMRLMETPSPAEQEAEFKKRVDEAQGEINEVFQDNEMQGVLDAVDYDSGATMYTRSSRYTDGYKSPRHSKLAELAGMGGFFSKEYNKRREHFSMEAWEEKQPHEMVGMAKAPELHIPDGSTTEKTRRRGVLGMLGMKEKNHKQNYRREPDMVKNPETGEMEQGYILEYNFIDVFDGEEANATGKKSGQEVQARIKLPESQAAKLAQILQQDPTMARSIVDRYMREKGDIGAWLADSYPDPNDPTVQERESSKRRPNYDDYPELKPDLYLPDFSDGEPKPQLLSSKE